MKVSIRILVMEDNPIGISIKRSDVLFGNVLCGGRIHLGRQLLLLNELGPAIFIERSIPREIDGVQVGQTGGAPLGIESPEESTKFIDLQCPDPAGSVDEQGVHGVAPGVLPSIGGGSGVQSPGPQKGRIGQRHDLVISALVAPLWNDAG